jgi:hypothetical protein
MMQLVMEAISGPVFGWYRIRYWEKVLTFHCIIFIKKQYLYTVQILFINVLYKSSIINRNHCYVTFGLQILKAPQSIRHEVHTKMIIDCALYRKGTNISEKGSISNFRITCSNMVPLLCIWTTNFHVLHTLLNWRRRQHVPLKRSAYLPSCMASHTTRTHSLVTAVKT